MQSQLIEKMQAWAKAKAEADKLATEIRLIAKQLGIDKSEVPTPQGNVIIRFTGRGSYNWERIAYEVLGERYKEIADKEATRTVEWESVAREVAPNEEVLLAAAQRYTTVHPPIWNEDKLKRYVEKSALKEIKGKHYTPPSKLTFKIELKPLK